MVTCAPEFCMRKPRSRWKSAYFLGANFWKRPGISARNSAPSPELRRSMSPFASWMAPESPVSRIPVPWSFLQTLAVRPVWSCSCRSAESLITWFTMLAGTFTVSESTVVMSSISSSIFSLASMALSRSLSLLQMRAERASSSMRTFSSVSMRLLIFARWPMDIGSTFLMSTAPSSCARTSLGSSPMRTPLMASLHLAICSFVP
mmetsp:Transcript_101689/g.242499  ORF Transcript_101689/g.242499 Transcript_101689/m.242499 type:complete len:204 (+) Transcript_101689:652-1263(+)